MRVKVFVAGVVAAGTGASFGTVPGELVRFPVEPCECLDCGAERSMYGLASHCPTAVVTVRDLMLDAATFSSVLWDSLERGGWVNAGDPADEAWVEDFASDHLAAAAHLPTEKPLGILHFQSPPGEEI